MGLVSSQEDQEKMFEHDPIFSETDPASKKGGISTNVGTCDIYDFDYIHHMGDTFFLTNSTRFMQTSCHGATLIQSRPWRRTWSDSGVSGAARCNRSPTPGRSAV